MGLALRDRASEATASDAARARPRRTLPQTRAGESPSGRGSINLNAMAAVSRRADGAGVRPESSEMRRQFRRSHVRIPHRRKLKSATTKLTIDIRRRCCLRSRSSAGVSSSGAGRWRCWKAGGRQAGWWSSSFLRCSTSATGLLRRTMLHFSRCGNQRRLTISWQSMAVETTCGAKRRVQVRLRRTAHRPHVIQAHNCSRRRFPLISR